MVQFTVKYAYQIMFWFNQLMGSGLVLFQVVMMTDNAVVDAIKLILLIYNNFSIVKKVVNKIVRVE